MQNAQSHISFLLNDQRVDIAFEQEGISPTMTVLNYVRDHAKLSGVKEGCAEGDCGACTLVIAEISGDGRLVYKAVNSCLVFLPQLHGKQLITVEHLQQQNVLHPVQQALVEHHGSQCGYCTPGIVMNLFSLYKNKQLTSKKQIQHNMAGNLCRCTGYQSIANAALSLDKNGQDHFSEQEKKTVDKLFALTSNASIFIRSHQQAYFIPATLSEALAFFDGNPDAVLINGSTDIALRQTKKYETIEKIMDLSGLSELKSISTDLGIVAIGAGVNLNKIAAFCEKDLPIVHQAINTFASHQIRNTATMAGNLATASPIGDLLPVLIALKAQVNLISNEGTRTLAVEDFITGYRSTDLQAGEIIHSMRIENDRERIADFYKISKRRDVDISTVSACFSCKVQNRQLQEVSVVFGGMAKKPKRAFSAEKFLEGQAVSEDVFLQAGKLVAKDFNPISDARSNATFRLQAAQNVFLKFYLEKLEPLIKKT